MKYYQSFLFYLACAMLAIAPFSGFAIVALVPMALGILAIDFILRKYIKNRSYLRIFQVLTLALFLLFPFFPRSEHPIYLKVNLPPDFVGEVMIVLGVEGAPPLESDTATIQIPSDGLFLTSTAIGRKDQLGTNLDQQRLAYYHLVAPPTFECGKYKIVDYRVSSVDSIRFVPDTFYYNRTTRYYDSLWRSCKDEGIW
jgi:hypothetical protein